MSAAQHTPGPWRIQGHDGDVKIIDSKGEALATVHCMYGVDDPEGHANARLIAAAPELLELALLAAEVGCHERAVDFLRDKARAAIAKAKGQS